MCGVQDGSDLAISQWLSCWPCTLLGSSLSPAPGGGYVAPFCTSSWAVIALLQIPSTGHPWCLGRALQPFWRCWPPPFFFLRSFLAILLCLLFLGNFGMNLPGLGRECCWCFHQECIDLMNNSGRVVRVTIRHHGNHTVFFQRLLLCLSSLRIAFEHFFS